MDLNYLETRRIYYKAHAPTEPLWYFDTGMPPRPTIKFSEGSTFSPSDEELLNWDREDAHRRGEQWPGIWADAQIAEDQQHEDNEREKSMSRYGDDIPY